MRVIVGIQSHQVQGLSVVLDRVPSVSSLPVEAHGHDHEIRAECPEARYKSPRQLLPERLSAPAVLIRCLRYCIVSIYLCEYVCVRASFHMYIRAAAGSRPSPEVAKTS
jgi:hypothetical protein